MEITDVLLMCSMKDKKTSLFTQPKEVIHEHLDNMIHDPCKSSMLCYPEKPV